MDFYKYIKSFVQKMAQSRKAKEVQASKNNCLPEDDKKKECLLKPISPKSQSIGL